MYTRNLELAKCPHCSQEAFGGDIEIDFGYRTYDDKHQSWCRECRKKSVYISAGKRESAHDK